MDPAQFAALGINLGEVRPIFDEFCARHAFVHANPLSLGRYPRIRVQRDRETRTWFDLWMGLDANGRRFEHYRPDLPYDLSAGVYIDVPDGDGGGTRFSSYGECLSAGPLHEITPILLQTMEQHLPKLETWTVQNLKEKGRRSPIGNSFRPGVKIT
jgi:hypothetical protein